MKDKKKLSGKEKVERKKQRSKALSIYFDVMKDSFFFDQYFKP